MFIYYILAFGNTLSVYGGRHVDTSDGVTNVTPVREGPYEVRLPTRVTR